MRLLAAIGHCLETGIAFLGTCGGFQYTAVALAMIEAAEASGDRKSVV